MNCSAQHFVAVVASWAASVLEPHQHPLHHHKQQQQPPHQPPVFDSVSYAFHHSPPGGGEAQAAQDAARESAAQCGEAPYVLFLS